MSKATYKKRQPGIVRTLLTAAFIYAGISSSAYAQERMITFPGGYLREEKPKKVETILYTPKSDSLESKLNNKSLNPIEQSYFILDSVYDSVIVETYRESISRVRIPKFLERSVDRFVNSLISTSTISNSTKYRDLYEIAADSTHKIVKPKELQATVIIESGGNIKARSPSDAVGLAQFIKGTGKKYVGPINGSLDFRLDPLSAVKGGAEYLQDLTELFGDKLLAVAAYNCGEGTLNGKKGVLGAINKQTKIYKMQGKNPSEAWKIENIFWHLPKETRNYVVSWLGNLIALDKVDYSVLPKYSDKLHRITTTQDDTLKSIAVQRGIPLREIISFNPHIINIHKKLPAGIAVNIPK